MKKDKKDDKNNERRNACAQNDKNDENKIENDDTERDKHYVRCLKCGQILHCSRYDSGVLLDHIRKEHPEIEIVDIKPPTETATSNERFSIPQCSNKSNKDSCAGPEIPTCGACTDSGIKKGCNSGKNSSQNQCSSRKPPSQNEVPKSARFRTSIELWRPMEGCLYCPHCSCTKPPLVKSRNELFTNNAFGSVCILSCWPLCFLPFCVSDDRKYLHCSNCNTFLGLYDRNNNCVRPNKKYIEENNCIK